MEPLRHLPVRQQSGHSVSGRLPLPWRFSAPSASAIVWTISDIGNALMAVPNIIAILLLSGMIARETKHYVYEDKLEEVYDELIPWSRK